MINNIAIITSMITAIAAIIAPVITSIINNRYQRKIRAMELYFVEKSAVYKELVEKIMLFTYCSGVDGDEYSDYLCCFEKAYLIADKKTLEKLDTLSNVLTHYRFTKSGNLPLNVPSCSKEELHIAIHNVTVALNEELQSYKLLIK